MPISTVIIPDLTLSPGEHNDLVAAILHEFAPRFLNDAQVLYIRDGSRSVVHESGVLRSLGMPSGASVIYPDVILFSRELNWLFLIDIVVSGVVIDEQRCAELADLFSPATTGIVQMTAFRDRSMLAQHLEQVNWQTEVWIADEPEHLIHFNGGNIIRPH
jgi:hypothetical protein